MANCGSNILAIARPSKNGGGCTSSCSADLKPLDPTYKSKLTPRKNREKVREQLKDYIVLKLGGPVIRLELDAQQLDLAVDEALLLVEQYLPRDYFQHHVFDTIPGQSVYTLPDEIGIIRSISYKQDSSFSFTASDLGGVIPIEYLYSGGGPMGNAMFNMQQPVWGHMVEWTLFKQYEHTFSKMSSNIGGYELIGMNNSVKLYPIPYGVHKVVVHYLQKQPDFREVTQAMMEGSLALAKEMLGRIRSYIKNAPGPGGGIQLDGDTLLQEARADLDKFHERLLIKYGDILPITMG